MSDPFKDTRDPLVIAQARASIQRELNARDSTIAALQSNLEDLRIELRFECAEVAALTARNERLTKALEECSNHLSDDERNQWLTGYGAILSSLDAFLLGRKTVVSKIRSALSDAQDERKEDSNG